MSNLALAIWIIPAVTYVVLFIISILLVKRAKRLEEYRPYVSVLMSFALVFTVVYVTCMLLEGGPAHPNGSLALAGSLAFSVYGGYVIVKTLQLIKLHNHRVYNITKF